MTLKSVGESKEYPVRGIPRVQSVCGQPQQAQAHPGHPAEKSGEADRVSVQVPHGQVGGRTVQRREGLPDQTDQGAEALARGCGHVIEQSYRSCYCCCSSCIRSSSSLIYILSSFILSGI